jgi:predicted alpha/beta hydrolase family esterase
MQNLFRTLSFALRNRNQTVFIVGGGEAHSTISDYITWIEELDITQPRKGDWKQWLGKTLPWHGYKVVRIQMPDKTNAYYEAWKAMFEKYRIRKADIVIGHSLGASFLYKYYHQKHHLPGLHLVAIANLDRKDWHIKPYANEFHFYHSKDDEICPIHTVQPFFDATNGEVEIFENRGHFLEPELHELLLNLTKR